MDGHVRATYTLVIAHWKKKRKKKVALDGLEAEPKRKREKNTKKKKKKRKKKKKLEALCSQLFLLSFACSVDAPMRIQADKNHLTWSIHRQQCCTFPPLLLLVSFFFWLFWLFYTVGLSLALLSTSTFRNSFHSDRLNSSIPATLTMQFLFFLFNILLLNIHLLSIKCPELNWIPCKVIAFVIWSNAD